MKRSSSLKRRVREIEQARGSGAVTLSYPDGSSQGFHLASKNDALEILLASFDIARSASVPGAPPPSNTRATAIARAIGKAEQVAPHSQLWDTVGDIVRGAEEDARNCTVHAPDPASS